MKPDLAFSRPSLTAYRLGDAATDRHRFLDKRVLLRGDDDVLSTPNGRLCMIASLSLLHRICRNMAVELPRSPDLEEELHAIIKRTGFGSIQTLSPGTADLQGHDAILSVGSLVRNDLPWTAVNCNGWLARV